jgi:adenylate cyclase
MNVRGPGSPAAGPPAPPRGRWSWATRHGLVLVAASALGTQFIGSNFNIWYNLTHVAPLLTADQYRLFFTTIGIYNGLAYPVATAVWFGMVFSMRRAFRGAMEGRPVPPRRMRAAQARAINLPWISIAISGTAWFLFTPLAPLVLGTSREPLDGRLAFHLPISVLVGGLIALTHSFFAVELLSQRLLFPVLFQSALPARTAGTLPVTLRIRGVLWAISTCVCPIISLLLLVLAPQATDAEGPWFPISVGAVAIAFGMSTAWMLGRLVTTPVHALRTAAQEVAAGRLAVRVEMPRADEFGPLIDEFNRMVEELREKQHLQETFGRHVGEEAAREILRRGSGVGGTEHELTVLFVDLRDFTARSSQCSAQQTVALLNEFLTEMAEAVEQHDGMVNKFLGDGLMALFGAADEQADHAQKAVAAGCEMLARMSRLNARLAAQGQAPLAIGIGIHSGLAVVGSIGSPRRLEYTAIGDTVNVASRVESLTKVLGVPLVMTGTTRALLPEDAPVRILPPQLVKGKTESLVIYGLAGRTAPAPVTGADLAGSFALMVNDK